MTDSFSIDMNWSDTKEGLEQIAKTNKKFGILENPPNKTNDASKNFVFKVMMYGKSAVGKTSLINLLTGFPLSQNHCPSTGIRITSRYWPVRLMPANSGAMFKIDFWDTGANSLSDYVDVFREKLDGILYVFSFKDKSTFLDIEKKVMMDEYLTRIVFGTKYDYVDCDIPLEEVKDLERRLKIQVIILPKNPNQSELSHIMNLVCSQLLSNKKTSMNFVKTKYQL